MININILHNALLKLWINFTRIEFIVVALLTALFYCVHNLYVYSYVVVISIYTLLWSLMMYRKKIQLTENIVTHPLIITTLGSFAVSVVLLSSNHLVSYVLLSLFIVALCNRIVFLLIVNGYCRMLKTTLLYNVMKAYLKYFDGDKLLNRLSENIDRELSHLYAMFSPDSISINEFDLVSDELNIHYYKHISKDIETSNYFSKIYLKNKKELDLLMTANQHRHFNVSTTSYLLDSEYRHLMLSENINHVLTVVLYTPYRKLFNPSITFRFTETPNIKNSDMQYIYYIKESIESYYNLIRLIKSIK